MNKLLCCIAGISALLFGDLLRAGVYIYDYELDATGQEYVLVGESFEQGAMPGWELGDFPAENFFDWSGTGGCGSVGFCDPNGIALHPNNSNVHSEEPDDLTPEIMGTRRNPTRLGRTSSIGIASWGSASIRVFMAEDGGSSFGRPSESRECNAARFVLDFLNCSNSDFETPQPNGCSAVPDSYNGIVDFAPGCNNHDMCYDTINANKPDCDQALGEELRATCDFAFDSNLPIWQINPDLRTTHHEQCRGQAQAYATGLISGLDYVVNFLNSFIGAGLSLPTVESRFTEAQRKAQCRFAKSERDEHCGRSGW